MKKLSNEFVNYIKENPDKLKNKELAEKFGISERTVTRYRTNDYKHKETDRRCWSKDDIDIFNKYKDEFDSIEKIAKATGKSKDTVRSYGYRHNIKLKESSVYWTPEMDEILRKSWGKKNIYSISKMVKKSVRACRYRAERLKLDSADETYINNSLDTIKALDFCEYMGISENMFRTFVRNGLKTRKKHKHILVRIDEALKWMEKHQEYFDASKIALRVFIPEPKWLIEKRKRDSNNGFKRKTTKQDYNRIVKLYNQNYTYKDIREVTGASYSSIHNAINHSKKTKSGEKWTDDEIKILRDNLGKLSYAQIALKLGRSVQAVATKGCKFKRQIKESEAR